MSEVSLAEQGTDPGKGRREGDGKGEMRAGQEGGRAQNRKAQQLPWDLVCTPVQGLMKVPNDDCSFPYWGYDCFLLGVLWASHCHFLSPGWARLPPGRTGKAL